MYCPLASAALIFQLARYYTTNMWKIQQKWNRRLSPFWLWPIWLLVAAAEAMAWQVAVTSNWLLARLPINQDRCLYPAAVIFFTASTACVLRRKSAPSSPYILITSEIYSSSNSVSDSARPGSFSRAVLISSNSSQSEISSSLNTSICLRSLA